MPKMPKNVDLYELNSKAMQLINIEEQCARNPSSSQDVLGELPQWKRAVLTEMVDNITYVNNLPESDREQFYTNLTSLKR